MDPNHYLVCSSCPSPDDIIPVLAPDDIIPVLAPVNNIITQTPVDTISVKPGQKIMFDLQDIRKKEYTNIDSLRLVIPDIKFRWGDCVFRFKYGISEKLVPVESFWVRDVLKGKDTKERPKPISFVDPKPIFLAKKGTLIMIANGEKSFTFPIPDDWECEMINNCHTNVTDKSVSKIINCHIPDLSWARVTDKSTTYK